MTDNKFMSTPYEAPANNCVAFMRLMVDDIARAKSFYEQVFGWIFQSEAYKPTILVFKTGGQVMGAMHLRDSGAGPAAGASLPIQIYIKVEDVAATLKKVEEAGGKVITDKFNEGGHTDMGEVEDSEGNRIGLLRWLM